MQCVECKNFHVPILFISTLYLTVCLYFMSTKLICRTEIHCREKWFNSLDPSVNAAPYSAAEDMRLVRVVYALQRIQDSSPTSTVSTTEDFTSATSQAVALDTQCLTSLLTHTDTSNSISWARVAAYLPGRTDASVRSRWNLLLKGTLT